MDIIMDTITFNIPADLKKSFQIKTIQSSTNMTDELIKFIREYVEK